MLDTPIREYSRVTTEGEPQCENPSTRPSSRCSSCCRLCPAASTVAGASRKHGIKDTTIHRWKKEFLTALPEIFAHGKPAEMQRLHKRIKELEQLAGRQAHLLEIAKKALARLGLPTRQRRELVEELRREYTVTDCCEALDLPRSTFYYQPQAKDDSAERSAIQDIAERFPEVWQAARP